MQLDIFNDSRDQMLRNDVLDALLQRDPAAARSAAQALAAEYPTDSALPAAWLLIDALVVGAARLHLADRIDPAARRLFGDRVAEPWLRPLWRQLAVAAAGLPYRPDAADDHAAALFLHARDWPAAAEAAGGIASWRRIPVPLAWMVEARCRSDGIAATWPLLAELAWLAPGRFDAVTKRQADPLFDALRKRFDTTFEGDGDISDLAWLPAWALVERPALAPLLGQAQAALQTAPEVGLRLMLELLGLERQGRHAELIDKRKRLRDLHAGLYTAYMATR